MTESVAKRLQKRFEVALHEYVLAQPEWQGKRNISYDDLVRGIEESDRLPEEEQKFISSLTAFSMQCDRRYREAREKGTAPRKLFILETLANNANNAEVESVRGDVSDDPAYAFLCAVEDQIEGLTAAAYRGRPAEIIESGGRNERESAENLEMMINNKTEFVNSLQNCILLRGRNKYSTGTSDWEEQAVVNEPSYAILTKLALYPNRQIAVAKFVELLPSYAWDTFFWEEAAEVTTQTAA